MKAKPNTSRVATETTTRRDPADGFERTAIVVDPGDDRGSIDLVDSSGTFLARINIFHGDEGLLMVDVIDVAERFEVHRGLGFVKEPGGGVKRTMAETSQLVGAHFEKVIKKH